jgi:hypothetical protein
MKNSLLLALVASTALATGAMAQSSDSSQSTTSQSTTGSTVSPDMTPDTSTSTGTTGSSASGTSGTTGTGTTGTGTATDSNVAGQSPNPNIYGGNRGSNQSGSGDNRYAQQNQQFEGQSGPGMHPWGYPGHHAMMREMMQQGMMQPGMMQQGMGMGMGA